MSATKKISDTSIRVLETLKILSQGKASIQDIIRFFEKNDPQNRVYTNEVILKYINTLKVFGIKFKKEKDKYVMLNSFGHFDFDEDNLDAIALINECSGLFPEEKIKTLIDKFLLDLEIRFNDSTKMRAQQFSKKRDSDIKIDYGRFAKKIIEYEKYCIDGQKIKITYVDVRDAEISVIVEPNEIKYNNEEVYFRVYNPISAEIQDINLSRIMEVKQLPQRANYSNMLSSVTFKLTGSLAKGYKLHEGEKMIQKEQDDSIVILNQLDDRSILLKRLMRYGENCEVVSPKYLREEMKNILTNMLINYENVDCR